LGAEVPLHFSAFHPDHKMQGTPATPVATLIRARELALAQGLHYVYTGNVHHLAGDATHCPQCNTTLIARDWYALKQYRLTQDGHCPQCGAPVAGRYDAQPGNFGRRRIPVTLAAQA
jgi:pyruvate formate lyase activating enzyme